MANGSDVSGATALVGLDGFVVKSQMMHEGEHWLLVETTATRAWCPNCGVAGVGNGRRRVTVRDLPIAGVPTVLVWSKRTFRCREPLCPRGSWSETSEQIAPRASLTERARGEICRRGVRDLDTVAATGRAFGVGWQCAHRAVIDHGDRLIEADERIERTSGLGVDEHTFQHANARRRTQMATTFVDIDHGRLVDVVPGRSADVVRQWVNQRPTWWADQVEVATIDAFRGYATAIGDVLPAATLVVDHFHTIRLASACVDDVRRRVQQDTLGHRGRKNDPLYGIRRLLLRTWAHLSERGWERLRAGLAAGDRDGEVAAVWLARELLVEVYAARDIAHARRRLIVFFLHAADAEVPELNRLARTIDAWREEILAYHATGGASNGRTEAVNLLIEKIRRIGHGYRNFDNYRRRLLLGCTLDEITDLVTAWAGGECGPIQDRLRNLVADKLAAAQAEIVELVTLTADLRRAASSLERHRPVGQCDDRCGCITDTSDAGTAQSSVGGQFTTAAEIDEPIACTLRADEVSERLDEWNAFMGRDGVTRSAIPGGVRLEFGGQIDVAELARLASAERQCCRFVSFRIGIDRVGVTLEVTAPDDALDLVHAAFGVPS